MGWFSRSSKARNATVRDAVVRQSVRVARAIAAIIRAIRSLWRRTSRKTVSVTLSMLSRIGGRGVAATLTKQFAALLARQATVVGEGFTAIREALTKELSALAGAEAEFVRQTLTDLVPEIPKIDLPKLDAAQKKTALKLQPFLGRDLNSHLGKLERDAIEALEAAMRQGIDNGESLERIMARIRERGAALGVTERNIERIVDAAGTAVANRVRRELFKAAGFTGYVWSAILDSRTCETCIALDGEKFDFRDGEAPTPPAHPYCRCAVIPFAGAAGDIPDDVDAHDWLAQQSEEVQDEVLGKVRAQLWREGKLPRNLDPRVLLDANNRPRRLKTSDIERILGRDRLNRARRTGLGT